MVQDLSYIKIAQNIPGFESFGTTPSELRNAMQKFTNDVRLEREASFEKLIGLVSRGIPVITLVRVGSIKDIRTGFTTWPALHWYVVSGYNAQKEEVYITDTNNNHRWISYDEFRSRWSWSVEKGAARTTLNSNGVKTRAMVWVDRTPFDKTAREESERRASLYVAALNGSGLTVCNNKSKQLSFAVAHFDVDYRRANPGKSRDIVKGWYKVDPGKCRQLIPSSYFASLGLDTDLYIHISGITLSDWATTRLCVDPVNAFSWDTNTQCSSSTRVTFSIVNRQKRPGLTINVQ